MSIISIWFMGFVLCVLFLLALGHRLLPEGRQAAADRLIMLAASFFFMGFVDWRFALILALLSVVTWLSVKHQKLSAFGVIFALLCLAYFKYTNFFIGSFLRLLGRPAHDALAILLPLGVSFYTFSAISYIADVRRGKIAPRSLSQVALYLSFFPKVTSGPIQRSSDFFAQTDKPAAIGLSSLSEGAQIYVFGMFKKLVLADRLSVFVNQVFATPYAFSSVTVLFAVIAYSLQIYFDFSGYSDMSVGVARMLGIRLPRNFNLPYLSHNVTEFWKRWHISLSSWLQDYLYISLGGSRKGTTRTYVNLTLVMLLGGLWHGASGNYLIWGLMHGLALAVHKLFMGKTGSAQKTASLPCRILSVLGTYAFICVTWVFFRAQTTAQALTILSCLLPGKSGIFHPYFWLFFALTAYLFCAALAALCTKERTLSPRRQNTSWVQGFYPAFDLSSFKGLFLFFVLCGLTLALAYTGGSPFIYGAY